MSSSGAFSYVKSPPGMTPCTTWLYKSAQSVAVVSMPVVTLVSHYLNSALSSVLVSAFGLSACLLLLTEALTCGLSACLLLTEALTCL